MCDVWEARYHADTLLPDGDEDIDGFRNLTESTAGTDPFGAMSPPLSTIGVPLEAGNYYQLDGHSQLERKTGFLYLKTCR